ncbi:MAG TPA: 50S ribosomal protein L5 [Candidatus Bilamarchaeaceae archaeon]|nr:50S ribosomal protein L5 [Candidatus Bilamarchaeaceae archaeon]
MNVMREIKIEKVTVNIGVGTPGDKLENAKTLLENITSKTPVETLARDRNPVFKLRKGLPIGAKVTLRGEDAKSFLEKALTAKKKVLKSQNFDRNGNFAFGVAEYIDFPGARYDPTIGMVGFDVCVTLKRPGKRIQIRRIRRSRLGKKHRITKEEAIEFAKNVLGSRIEE